MPARKKATKESAPVAAKKKSAPKRARTKKAAPAESPLTRAPRPKAAAGKGRPAPVAGGRSLVIVESPAKAKTIQKYLGPGFEVAASFGHVRDLAKKSGRGNIGIDIEAGWVPTYVVEPKKKDVIADLKKRVAHAGMVYLAPDPDREGEAIAWHLKETLELDDDRVQRVAFNEITKRAIQEAFQQPGEINMDLVRAQEARRFLDRVVGFKLSPLLSKKIVRGLSAGRVQSVAVRMIVEREREIEAFRTEEYWKIIAHLTPELARKLDLVNFRLSKKTAAEDADRDDAEADTEAEDTERHEQEPLKPVNGETFLAELAEWDGQKFKAGSEEAAGAVATVLQGASYRVSKVEQKDRPERPLPPFTTSTLQQQANIRFNMSAVQTMSTAQKLYEGVELGSEGAVALITYMRTDSTRVSEDALRACRDHINTSYGADYLPESANRYSSGKSAQEAHEAVRPTDLSYTPQRVAPFLNDFQRKLYDLIYRRFVASQMKPAIFAITNVEVQADRGLFKAQGKILKFDGYRKVLAPRGKQEDATLPALTESQPLGLLDLLASQHFTQPPPRFNEASLVKALEKEGIGRPSTYAAIIEKIKERKYVALKERRFYATGLGKLVTDKLVDHFPKVMDIKFTSHMEEELDQIEERKIEWTQVLDEFYGPFSEALDAAQEGMEAVKGRETGETCPKCNKNPLVTRFSAKTHKEFIGCSGWPDCDYIKPEEGEEARPAPVETEHKCPFCGKSMLLRQGPRGPFLGCSGYPECTTTMNLDADGTPVPTAQPTEHVCEKCGKPLILRNGRRGPFLGCSGYPKCRNIVEADAQGNPVKPADTGIKCEKCQAPMHIKRGPRGPFLGCSAYPKCRSTMRIPEELKEKLKDLLPAPRPKVELPKVHIEETCPECGAAMELRRGRRGYFLGCSMYAKTKCKGSAEVPPEVRDQLQQQPASAV